MATLTGTYQIRPIDSTVVAALRDRDDAGREPRVVTTHDGGSPLRCCLRRARADEPMLLASYAPLRRWARESQADPGPYDEIGPVFIHAAPCDGPANDEMPADLFDVRRVFRKYDATGTILDGRLVEPHEEPERVLDEIFADPAVVLVHCRAVEFGCFTFEARRTM